MIEHEEDQMIEYEEQLINDFDQYGPFLVKYINSISKYNGSTVWLTNYTKYEEFGLIFTNFTLEASGMPKKSNIPWSEIWQTDDNEPNVIVTNESFDPPVDILGRTIDIGDFVHTVDNRNSIIGKVKSFTKKGGIRLDVVFFGSRGKKLNKPNHTINVNKVKDCLILDPDSEAITYAALTK